jgi:peroxiredoxin
MLLDTPICEFDWQAPAFSLKDATGKTYHLENQLGDKGLLIMFICNHCPYVQRIADNLAQDCQLLTDEGINVLAIMSNDYRDYAADSPENMIKFAKQHNFSFPYLIDENQSVGKEYGAICTPDFFGFNNQGKLQYRGRLDNSKANYPSHSQPNRVPELVNAMREIAQTGKGPALQTPSMGCSIKWRS